METIISKRVAISLRKSRDETNVEDVLVFCSIIPPLFWFNFDVVGKLREKKMKGKKLRGKKKS